MTTQVFENLRTFDLKNFSIETLRVESHLLKNNPLGDSCVRYNPILKPQNPGPWPVVVLLAGFTGNSPFYFNSKFNERNTIQVIDQACSLGEAPEALYVFVDALTSWGGSQFINSCATGPYEDYLMQEILPLLRDKYPLINDSRRWCVAGGSSGGYGALHLGSKYPEIFGWIGAVAPDSFFEASLISDLYQALPQWQKYGESATRVLEDLRQGKLMKKRNWHNLLNAFGMAACYSPTNNHIDFELPLDTYTGKIKPEVWEKWQQKDPLHFLPERISNLKKLEGVYIDVGSKDNFHLQFGARQISQILKSKNIPHEYVEFDGDHFDIGERRIEVWKWLNHQWV
jgi:enterochelin esterase-like enzyme